jgi:hypothetical protein
MSDFRIVTLADFIKILQKFDQSEMVVWTHEYPGIGIKAIINNIKWEKEDE